MVCFIKNNQQIFDWTIELTRAGNYQDLTVIFLDILRKLPQIEKVEAFEVYSGKHRKTDELNQYTEQLVRRFPLDFTSENEENNLAWRDSFEQAVEIKVSAIKPSEKNPFLLPIKGTIGPDRAVIIHGVLQEDCLLAIGNLFSIDYNQFSLHDSKERDVLTQLPNRQSFQHRIMQVCEYFQQHQMLNKNSWLAMLNIDHFKRVNDTFGHLYGDEVLLIFSQLMEKNFRHNDFLFRFGGEAFVVILNRAERDNAEKAFNAFREMVASYAFPTVGKVTVSIGVEHIKTEAIPTTLLDRADQALYYAKDNGRNQVIFFNDIAGEQK